MPNFKNRMAYASFTRWQLLSLFSRPRSEGWPHYEQLAGRRHRCRASSFLTHCSSLRLVHVVTLSNHDITGDRKHSTPRQPLSRSGNVWSVSAPKSSCLLLVNETSQTSNKSYKSSTTWVVTWAKFVDLSISRNGKNLSKDSCIRTVIRVTSNT